MEGLRFAFRTDCIGTDGDFTVRTVCSVYRDDSLLLETVCVDSTRDETFRRILERFEDRGSRWLAERIVEVQREQAREKAERLLAI